MYNEELHMKKKDELRSFLNQGVYVLHFSKDVQYETKRYGPNRYGNSRHYVGYSADINHRISSHLLGYGSKITKLALKQGCMIQIGAIYPGAEDLEKIVQQSDINNLCKICLEYTWKN